MTRHIHYQRSSMEIFKNLPEGTLAELIDNVMYMSPTPITEHARISRDIVCALWPRCQAYGEVFYAPYDVYLDNSRNVVQPDVFVVLKTNPSQPEPKGHFHGVPDFIVEILSPSNKYHDLVRKKELYESKGVTEYWIVDASTKKAMGYFYRNGKYDTAHEFIGQIASEVLGVTISF